MERWLFENPIFAIILYLVFSIADYYLTIVGARYYRQNRTRIEYETGYELNPRYQTDINKLNLFSPRFVQTSVIILITLSLAFFLKFGRFINVEPAWTLGLYVSFITTLMLVFGLGFQTPIAMFILNKTGLVSLGGLRKSRRYVLLGIFVVAAIATPGPDVISQVALAIPLYSLFELGILLCRLSERKKMKKEKEKKKEKECPPSQTEVY